MIIPPNTASLVRDAAIVAVWLAILYVCIQTSLPGIIVFVGQMVTAAAAIAFTLRLMEVL